MIIAVVVLFAGLCLSLLCLLLFLSMIGSATLISYLYPPYLFFTVDFLGVNSEVGGVVGKDKDDRRLLFHKGRRGVDQ